MGLGPGPKGQGHMGLGHGPKGQGHMGLSHGPMGQGHMGLGPRAHIHVLYIIRINTDMYINHIKMILGVNDDEIQPFSEISAWNRSKI